ncbi:pyridoxal-dependent decarboxylase [Beauveria bassiana ARSEF 2860]|uniref:Pyridoxal-dependent decarboxylase n=1 Tax=Beauveria bassiana (strain ARSEF 2860) TaxID=655819 RepID=J5JDQ7_BEAB2|nr:pyridoxal-dependent decarboxylase [Beauveria bassiana ARSEF 2860]EJP64063.1 pyridoxal-dependent decarboxylase [Beauveria bassiana ARSEF 2860]
MDNLFDIAAQERRFAQRHAPSSSSSSSAPPTLPALTTIRAAEASLPNPSSPSYLAGATPSAVASHIARDIAPALTGQNASSRYLGFVTGGTLPLAEWADNVVSALDQNVQVHLPTQTVATAVEDAALEMLARVLRLPDTWRGRTLTTGATASNILGLACGREHVIGKKLAAGAGDEQEEERRRRIAAVGEMGLLAAARAAGVDEIQVLTSMGHSSLGKAASVVGLGRRAVKELRLSEAEPWRFDIDAAEAAMQRPGVATILGISAGEVNTGRYALQGIDEWKRVRALADRYGAWIHVDGAFGVFARALEQTDQYKVLHQRLDGIELADSITIDGHKLLNVPYDCGMFFCKSSTIMQSVFTNPGASYLSSSATITTSDDIPSPLNIGLENSRRFRALPVYAVLLSEGRPGLAALLGAMTQLSRAIAAFLRDSPDYELLPEENDGAANDAKEEEEEIFISVLFRATNAALNETLVARINDTRQLYVSGTTWRGRKAVRIAVSNWRVNAERDAAVVREILTCVAQGREFDLSNCQGYTKERQNEHNVEMVRIEKKSG